jgi:hypothetical protein
VLLCGEYRRGKAGELLGGGRRSRGVQRYENCKMQGILILLRRAMLMRLIRDYNAREKMKRPTCEEPGILETELVKVWGAEQQAEEFCDMSSWQISTDPIN